MDDILTSLIDDNEPRKGKFESVQSRFLRLHVPVKDVEWNICDYCGEVIHRMVFERHIIFHEMTSLTYQLFHHEIDVEKRRNEQEWNNKVKEAKTKRRNLGLELSSCSSSSSLPSSSEDNSGYETETSTSSSSSSNSSLIYPDTIEFNNKNGILTKEKKKSPKTADWIMEELMNEKLRKKQRKLYRDEFGFDYFDEYQPFQFENNDNINNFKKSKNKKLNNKQQQKSIKTSTISIKKRPPKKLIKIKKEIKEEIKQEIIEIDEKQSKLENYEHLLCLKNLGRRYEFACVDLRNCKYFDAKGNIRVANVLKKSPETKPIIRRSTRRNGDGEFIRLI